MVITNILGVVIQTEMHFVDQDQVAHWAKDAVMTATAYGIILGNDKNEVRPTANASRAEAATMIYRLIQVLDNK